MHLTQGTFSFLPELTDDEIAAQLAYALRQGWSLAIEYTDDPHPRNTYWEMWGLPMFDLADPAGALQEIRACRQAFPGCYVKVNAIDATLGFETTRLSFIVNRPEADAGFTLRREDASGRRQRYGLERTR